MPNTELFLPPNTGLILLAAGAGTRFGRDKMWVILHERPLILWSLTTCLDTRPETLVLVHSKNSPPFATLDDREYLCVVGGATRRQSVLAGLAALPRHIDRVLIHDAARPGISRKLLVQVCTSLQVAPAVLPVLPIRDTIRQIHPSKTLDRSNMCAAQTPQGFDRSILETALAQSDDTQSDEIQAVEALGYAPTLRPGNMRNMKVTDQEDLKVVESLMAGNFVSVTGSGFDVHRFCLPDEHRGRQLTLGGVKLPGSKPLAGHSDADVILHALCDAIYGALGEGDIGQHFPPTDAKWRDQDSRLFLNHALERVKQRGGSLVHMDLTLICETPKLSDSYDRIKAHLSDMVDLPCHRIGLKATTTERLGFVGRAEGIAAQAMVTVRLPA